MVQRIDNNQGQVTQTGDIHVHAAKLALVPPENHQNSRECPQCHGETWRLTQWCVHCGADLFAIDGRVRDRLIARRSLKVAGILLVVGGAAFYAQFHVPPAARLWVMGFASFSLFLAAAVLKR